ncbi:MAG: acyl-CoA thioester hydrolase/BAAT C-terminal domain-containing protein [Oscillospiraceae bacterium]
MAPSPGVQCYDDVSSQKDYGHHNYPLERIERAIEAIKSIGNRKIGIVGASTTGMLALVAASYYKDISLTIAMTPCDFIMEGFYQDGKDGARSIPAVGVHHFPIRENRFHTCPTPTATPSIGR